MSFYTHIKTTIRTTIATGICCLLLSTAASGAELVTVTKENVNVRTGPGTTNPIFMELFKGYPLKVLEWKGEWAQITDYEGDSGWIHKSLIGKNNTVIINAKKSVNMRSGPSTTSPVIAEVERGVIMTTISEKGKWMQLKHSSGTVGWIFKPLLWP